MKLLEICKELSDNDVDVSISYHKERQQFCLDLNTQAKSHLYLFEDGTLEGRYGYSTRMDFLDCASDIVRSLCFEFLDCLCGRDYYNWSWMELCRKLDIPGAK